MRDLCHKVNEFGRGISNQNRYLILEALMNEPLTVNQLVKLVGLSQPAVSQNLRTLKDCNLVLDKRHGQEVIYSVNTKYLLSLLKSLTEQAGKGAEHYA